MRPEHRAVALVAAFLATAMLSSSCSATTGPCPRAVPVGLDRMSEITADDDLPFRFPLDASEADADLYHAWFCDANERDGKRTYHAAEDFRRPAGTPVYAIADGRISYSGRAGGYGWLVIVDHPQFNLYSLYGHLSPSRWSHEPGPVSKGELLGYLGDPWENGGSAESPLEPHLHFGLRAGQRADYPGRGEWRWMAGWIKLCPREIGWLQPSLVITTGAVPAGGFIAPAPGFLAMWGLEILVTLAYSAAGAGILVLAVRKRSRLLLIIPGLLVIAAGIVLHGNRILRTYSLLAIGIILTGIGVYYLLVLCRKPRPSPPASDQGMG